MSYCINCGKHVDPEGKFCVNCGQPLEAEEQTSSKEDDAEAKRKEEESAKKAEEEKPRSNTAVWVLSIFLVLLVIGAGILGSMLMGASDKYDTLEAQHTTTVGALNQANEVIAEFNSTISDFEDDISDLNNQVSSLTAENDDLQDELDDINEVFPPRNFSSYGELTNWLASNDVSGPPYTPTVEEWYARAMELQQDALDDGYIISVDIDYFEDGANVWCVAIINGSLFYWDPELDDVNQDTPIGAKLVP